MALGAATCSDSAVAGASSTRLDRAAVVAFVGAFLAVALAYLAVFVVPPLIAVFVDDLGLSHSQAGALMSVYVAGYALTSLVSGQLADRYGAIAVMAAGLVLAAASTLLFVATENLAVFLVSRAGVGIATALVYSPGITFVARLLPERQLSTGIGIYFSGLSAGVTVAFVSVPLLEDSTSWRWPFVVFGIAIAIGAVAFPLMARPVAARASRPQQVTSSGRVPVWRLMRDPSFLYVCATLFAGMFVAYGVFTWIAPFMDESAGFSPRQISLALGVSVALGMPATVIAGWASDRSGRPLSVAAVAYAMIGSLLVLAAVDQISFALATAMALVASFGATGGLVPLFALPSMVVTPEAAATATGIATAAAMSGAIASTFLGGWLIGVSDGYAVPFVVYVVASAAAVAIVFPLAYLSLRSRRRRLATEPL